MKRPAGVIVTAVLQGLGSLFVLLMAAMMAIVPRFMPQSPDTPQLPTGFFLAIAAMYLFFAVLGVATAVGIFQVKRWARYSTLIYAGFLVFFGLVAALISVLVPQPPLAATSDAQLPVGFTIILRAVIVFLWLSTAGLGGWWLYYFNRRDIRARFEGHTIEAIANQSRRPLSILILAVLNLVALPTMLFGVFKPYPTLLFGVILRGTAARIVCLTLAVVLLYLGVGLLRLASSCRWVAMWFYVFGCLNTVVSWALPGRDERYRQIADESMRLWGISYGNMQVPRFAAGYWIGVIISVLFSAVAVYFLITRRYAFEQGAIPSA